MALRDVSGAVDFTVLESMTAGDDAIGEEVLGLFVQQAAIWSPMLDVRDEGWRDAVHTLRGAAAGIGAKAVAQACAEAEGGDKATVSPLFARKLTCSSTSPDDDG